MNLERMIQRTREIESNPLVSRVITRKTSFRREVIQFYGIPDSPGSLTEEDTNKIGTYPADTVQVLESINDKDFDPYKLQYEKVREDHITNEKMGRCTGHVLGGFIPGTLCFFGALGTLLSPSYDAPAEVTTSLLAGAAAFYTYSLASYVLTQRKDISCIDEYNNLLETAWKTDDFLWKDYRNHLIDRSLEGVIGK